MTSCFVFAFVFVAVLAVFTGAGPVSSWKSSIAIATTKLVLMRVNYASFIWGIQKADPRKRVTIPAMPTFVSIYRRKKLTPLEEQKADNSACPCPDCLALTKCLYRKKLALSYEGHLTIKQG